MDENFSCWPWRHNLKIRIAPLTDPIRVWDFSGTEGAWPSTFLQNLKNFEAPVFPLGGAKVRTLDPIFSGPMDRKWIKFGGKVDLG